VDSVRGERMLMEHLEYNLLFRWFVAWPWTTRCGRRHVARALEATPHLAQKKKTHSLDGRTTRRRDQPGRKRIEVFGWMKTVGGLRRLRHRGGARVNWQCLLAAAPYNLVRMRTLERRREGSRTAERGARDAARRPVTEYFRSRQNA
jgi:hypothetical protein